jgi:hypothetical protein
MKQYGFNGMNPKPFRLIGFEAILGSPQPRLDA